MISRNDYITASGKYPERLKSKELTQEVLKNIDMLLAKVNALLKELGITDSKVSSGFRPSSVNASIKNSAKRSLHMVGKAIDLESQELAIKLKEKPELLDKYELWLENPQYTPSWTHLDIGTRSDREVRIFNP